MRSGLEDAIAASTRLSRVDGEAGKLVIAGYSVDDLAPAATFEEVVFLLLNGRLPEPAESSALAHELATRRALPEAAVALLRAAAAAGATPMDALRMAVAAAGLGRREEPDDDALTAIAVLPTIVGTYERLRRGEAPMPIREDLGHAAYYLYQLSGSVASAERTRALETYLNTVCDHGLNASTFAARVIVSTRSDVLSAITGALGALKGPLHGGAPGPALDLVVSIGTAQRAEPVLRAMLDRGERLMGFGHRVYRVRDPRAEVLGAAAERFYASDADRSLYELARHVETTALRLLRERKPDRRLATNVEFYTALLLHGIGLPADLFTPTFAVGRVAGWAAHCLEQLRDGRLIRPRSLYVGPEGLRYSEAAAAPRQPEMVT